MKKFSSTRLGQSLSRTRLLAAMDNLSISPYLFTAVFLCILWLRVVMESHITGGFLRTGILFTFYEFVHFSLLLFMLLAGIALVCKIVLHIRVWTSFILLLLPLIFFVLLPPLIDTYFFSDVTITSYYEFYSLRELLTNFYTFMSHEPYDGTTPGQRITVALTLIILAPCAYWRAHSFKFLRMTCAVSLVYLMFYITATLPSLVVLSLNLFPVTLYSVSDITIAQFFFAPLLHSAGSLVAVPSDIIIHFKVSLILILIDTLVLCGILYFARRPLFLSLVANMRPLQVFYHIGLLGLGIITAISVRESSLTFTFFNVMILGCVILAIILAWYSSVIINDYYDQGIDKTSNPSRPLLTRSITATSYFHLGILFAVISSSLILYLNVYCGFFMIAYHALTFLYNAPPLRLKRFPIIATAVSALASLFIVFIGYSLVMPSHTIELFPPPLAWLIIITMTLSLPIKDLKDELGDRAERIWTLPALLGQSFARLVIGAGLFFSYILSVFLLGELTLFFWALICGTASFWLITKKKKGGSNEFLFHAHSVPTFIFIILLFFVAILLSRVSLAI